MKMHQNLPKIRVLSEDQQSVDGEESAGNGRSYSLANPIANPNGSEKAGGEPEENGSNRHRLATNDAKQSMHLWSRKLSLNEPKKSADQATMIGSRKHSLREPSPQQQGNGSSSLLSPDFHRGSIQSTASSTKAKQFRSRASELIIRIPARQLKRIARAQGIGSLQRETQHFVGITSINGLLRIYRSRGVFRLCWVLVTILSLSVLVWQIYKLCHLYQTRPTVSQVSFLLPENGLPFPAVTICSHNPIRRAYVESLNRTGSFPQQLLNYAMYSFMDPQYLLSLSREGKLTDPQLSDEEWKDFVRYSESKFTVNGFFWNASTSCQQMLKYCSFGGREFDCCAYAKGILTDIGKCYQLSFDDDTDKKWLTMRAGQVQAGINNGLQIIADAHIEEQINSIALWSGHAFADNFENGFRYYVHEQQAMPYLSTEGISVSPGTKVYSAISPTKYFLLSTEEWGNCTHQWPEELQQILDDGGMNLSYTSLKCKTLCQAKFFHDHCGCSPFIFNIEEYYDMCTPYETLVCMNKTTHINHLNNVINASHTFDLLKIFTADNFIVPNSDWPTCTECKIECHRSVYHIYNSYAQGFARSFLNWMAEKNPTWSPGHVRSNFVSINIFYRDISYTEYKQVQSLSMTEILSDIGGNMGLFLGMSLISFIELGTFLCKLTWLFISKQRREHMLAKKCRDEEREKRLQATLEFAAQQRKFASGIGRMMSQVIVPLAGVEAGGGNENVSAGIDGGAAATGIGSFHRRLRRIASNTRPRKWTMTASRSRVAPLNVAGILDATTAPEHAGSPAADANRDQPIGVDRRRRSNSVFAKLFAPNQRRQSTISVSSEGPKPWQQQQQQRNDFVESVIQSRLHGDAGRAARRKSSTSSSSSSDSSTENGNSDAEEEEMTTKERADKLVELKINLDALAHRNSAKAVALVKPIRRRKSAFAMRTRSVDQRQPQQQQSSELGLGVQRRVSTFAHPPIQQLLPFASHSQSPTTAGNNLVTRTQSSASSAGLLARNVRGPTIIEAEVEIEGQRSQKRKQSLVNTVAAFFAAGTSAAGHGPRQEKRSDPEAPKLSQIAQKYSLASSQ